MEAGDDDHEDGGAIAAVGPRQVEAARLAARRDLQEAFEQVAFAAVGAAARQAGQEWVCARALRQ